MNEYEINDSRTTTDFRQLTFSKFSRSRVKKELFKAIHNNTIEPACYWSVELICAGHFNDIWNIIIHYMSKHIHIANPKLPIYLSIRFQAFKNIVTTGYLDNELYLRNNEKIRKIFAEIICIICNSRKKHAFENYSIKDDKEFDITNMTYRLKAPSIQYAHKIFRKDDPKELFIAINEFMYQISSKVRDPTNACYWFEWLSKFETISKNKKLRCDCERRTFVPVQDKFQMDVVWLIWDALLNEAKKKLNSSYEKIIKALLELYCIKYNNSAKNSKRYLVYAAINFITEEPNMDIALTTNKEFIANISSKINIIYKQVKSNEVSPNTDYLFTDVKETNIDKTMKKLETLNRVLIKNQ